MGLGIGPNKDRVQAAIKELQQKKAAEAAAAGNGEGKENEAPATPAPQSGGGGSPAKASSKRDRDPNEKAAALAATKLVKKKQRKRFIPKDPCLFFLYYFGLVIVAACVVRVINGPFQFEQKILAERDRIREIQDANEEALRVMKESIPLVFAAGDGNTTEVERLLALGQDVMERSPAGETPLHTAAISGKPVIVKMLLDAGADPDARTMGREYLKMTPAHWMVFGNKREALKILIDAGADVNAMNTKGKTPTDMAWDLPKDTREGILTLLLENGGKKGEDLNEDPPEDDPDPPEDDPDPAEATTATDAEEVEPAEPAEAGEPASPADAESAAEL